MEIRASVPNRRRQPREVTYVDGCCSDGTHVAWGVVRDLSDGGIFFEPTVDPDFPLFSPIQIQFFTAENREPTICEGHVQWAGENAQGFRGYGVRISRGNLEKIRA